VPTDTDLTVEKEDDVDRVTIKSFSDAAEQAMDLGRGISRLLVGPDEGIDSIDLHVNELIPGGGLGNYHYHARAHNVYLVLEGTMEAVIDGRWYLLPENGVAVIPAGVPHAAGNAGDTLARIIEVYAPAGKDFNILADPETVVDNETGEVIENPFERS
jgi:mannose-6-phosphate isomerase-like protein (cupin superfamily)